MRRLRERGIYLTPDGQSLVASKLRHRGGGAVDTLSAVASEISCFLFDRYQWALHGTADFEIAENGLVVSAQPTTWGLDHLIDTEATAGDH